MSQAVGLRRECAPRAQRIRGVRRPRGVVAISTLAVSLVAVLGGSTAASAAPEASVRAAVALSAASEAARPDTSTLRTIMNAPEEAPELTIVGSAPSIAGERAHAVTYTSGGLTVSGVIRTPQGEGPFPAVSVVHGSVNPKTYQPGGDILPEQKALLKAGYVVFAIDMRGYADSDPADSERSFIVDTGFGWETVFDFGMVLDVVNSLRLLRDGAIPAVDPSWIGLLGHSMGGMLAIDAAVVAPGLADQVVAAAAAGSDFPSMIADAPDGGAAFADAYRKFGTPEQNPGYWADISARTFFDRATEPLFLVHGGADPATSPTWSLDTAKAWRDAGGTADTLIIEGADHHFNPKRSTADAAIVAAFDAVLKAQG